MRHLYLLKAMMKKNFLIIWRYPFNLISGIFSIFLIFLVIFYGARFIAGGNPTFGNTEAGIIMGFILWTFIIFAFSDLTWDFINEAQQGTLEQLYMSPLGFGWVSISYLLTFLAINLAITFGLFFLIMTVTGKWLHLDLLSLIPLMLLTVWGVYGFGFAMGGLALVFKQVQAAFQVFQFVWLLFVLAPTVMETMPWVKFLPVTWGVELIGRVLIGGQSLYTMPATDIGLLAATSASYFVLGYVGFKYLETIARDKGLLGHY
ncbi:ABC transporter permease [Candidatus Acetothermia bacterium]|jgi:ABC-2 type transport system permease protein|nr:ABC transporter permease [Candidatus Acetothermia bacterium]MCI2430950.1 ABC transporter permease [Candidatus Acetothermia bacterium]MCI2437028.1 ABC transporter permease [Candidatus Acetothermia bacterium]